MAKEETVGLIGIGLLLLACVLLFVIGVLRTLAQEGLSFLP